LKFAGGKAIQLIGEISRLLVFENGRFGHFLIIMLRPIICMGPMSRNKISGPKWQRYHDRFRNKAPFSPRVGSTVTAS
jgi:hypothetical protein